MVPTMVTNGVALVCDASHEVGPLISVPPKDEETCFHPARLQRIEHAWRRNRIRPVVERQANDLARSIEPGDRHAEQVAVRIVQPVDDRGCDTADRERRDHATTRTPPRTLWYTSSTCVVT